MRPMGKVEISIPLVTWRDGRPRFFPSPAARALGYAGEDLRHGPVARGVKRGPWFTLEECMAWSKARLAELAEKRGALAGGDTTPRKVVAATRRARRPHGLLTVGQLVEKFRASPRMLGKEVREGKKRRQPLSPGTIKFYRGAASCLEKFDNGFAWAEPAAELTSEVLSGLLDGIEKAHGLSQARNVRSLVSAAWSWGRAEKLVAGNPVAELEARLPELEPDVRPASVEEIEVLIAGVDALGFPDVGDMVAWGPWCGQRQNDRLALMESQITTDGVYWQPNKKRRRKERLLIPLAPIARARLEAARARRSAWKVTKLENDRHVFICERTQRPWKADWYVKCFRVLSYAVATGELYRDRDGKLDRAALKLLRGVDIKGRLAAAGVPLMPSLATLNDKHLRDTCLNWLQLAGAKPYLPGFSGHAYGHDDAILKHYLAVPPELARQGMALLEAWHAGKLAEKRRAG